MKRWHAALSLSCQDILRLPPSDDPDATWRVLRAGPGDQELALPRLLRRLRGLHELFSRGGGGPLGLPVDSDSWVARDPDLSVRLMTLGKMGAAEGKLSLPGGQDTYDLTRGQAPPTLASWLPASADAYERAYASWWQAEAALPDDDQRRRLSLAYQAQSVWLSVEKPDARIQWNGSLLAERSDGQQAVIERHVLDAVVERESVSDERPHPDLRMLTTQRGSVALTLVELRQDADLATLALTAERRLSWHRPDAHLRWYAVPLSSQEAARPGPPSSAGADLEPRAIILSWLAEDLARAWNQHDATLRAESLARPLAGDGEWMAFDAESLQRASDQSTLCLLVMDELPPGQPFALGPRAPCRTLRPSFDSLDGALAWWQAPSEAPDGLGPASSMRRLSHVFFVRTLPAYEYDRDPRFLSPRASIGPEDREWIDRMRRQFGNRARLDEDEPGEWKWLVVPALNRQRAYRWLTCCEDALRSLLPDTVSPSDPRSPLDLAAAWPASISLHRAARDLHLAPLEDGDAHVWIDVSKSGSIVLSLLLAPHRFEEAELIDSEKGQLLLAWPKRVARGMRGGSLVEAARSLLWDDESVAALHRRWQARDSLPPTVAEVARMRLRGDEESLGLAVPPAPAKASEPAVETAPPASQAVVERANRAWSEHQGRDLFDSHVESTPHLLADALRSRGADQALVERGAKLDEEILSLRRAGEAVALQDTRQRIEGAVGRKGPLFYANRHPDYAERIASAFDLEKRAAQRAHAAQLAYHETLLTLLRKDLPVEWSRALDRLEEAFRSLRSKPEYEHLEERVAKALASLLDLENDVRDADATFWRRKEELDAIDEAVFDQDALLPELDAILLQTMPDRWGRPLDVQDPSAQTLASVGGAAASQLAALLSPQAPEQERSALRQWTLARAIDASNHLVGTTNVALVDPNVYFGAPRDYTLDQVFPHLRERVVEERKELLEAARQRGLHTTQSARRRIDELLATVRQETAPQAQAAGADVDTLINAMRALGIDQAKIDASKMELEALRNLQALLSKQLSDARTKIERAAEDELVAASLQLAKIVDMDQARQAFQAAMQQAWMMWWTQRPQPEPDDEIKSMRKAVADAFQELDKARQGTVPTQQAVENYRRTVDNARKVLLPYAIDRRLRLLLADAASKGDTDPLRWREVHRAALEAAAAFEAFDSMFVERRSALVSLLERYVVSVPDRTLAAYQDNEPLWDSVVKALGNPDGWKTEPMSGDNAYTAEWLRALLSVRASAVAERDHLSDWTSPTSREAFVKALAARLLDPLDKCISEIPVIDVSHPSSSATPRWWLSQVEDRCWQPILKETIPAVVEEMRQARHRVVSAFASGLAGIQPFPDLPASNWWNSFTLYDLGVEDIRDSLYDETRHDLRGACVAMTRFLGLGERAGSQLWSEWLAWQRSQAEKRKQAREEKASQQKEKSQALGEAVFDLVEEEEPSQQTESLLQEQPRRVLESRRLVSWMIRAWEMANRERDRVVDATDARLLVGSFLGIEQPSASEPWRPSIQQSTGEALAQARQSMLCTLVSHEAPKEAIEMRVWTTFDLSDAETWARYWPVEHPEWAPRTWQGFFESERLARDDEASHRLVAGALMVDWIFHTTLFLDPSRTKAGVPRLRAEASFHPYWAAFREVVHHLRQWSRILVAAETRRAPEREEGEPEPSDAWLPAWSGEAKGAASADALASAVWTMLRQDEPTALDALASFVELSNGQGAIPSSGPTNPDALKARRKRVGSVLVDALQGADEGADRLPPLRVRKERIEQLLDAFRQGLRPSLRSQLAANVLRRLRQVPLEEQLESTPRLVWPLLISLRLLRHAYEQEASAQRQRTSEEKKKKKKQKEKGKEAEGKEEEEDLVEKDADAAARLRSLVDTVRRRHARALSALYRIAVRPPQGALFAPVLASGSLPRPYLVFDFFDGSALAEGLARGSAYGVSLMGIDKARLERWRRARALVENAALEQEWTLAFEDAANLARHARVLIQVDRTTQLMERPVLASRAGYPLPALADVCHLRSRSWFVLVASDLSDRRWLDVSPWKERDAAAYVPMRAPDEAPPEAAWARDGLLPATARTYKQSRRDRALDEPHQPADAALPGGRHRYDRAAVLAEPPAAAAVAAGSAGLVRLGDWVRGRPQLGLGPNGEGLTLWVENDVRLDWTERYAEQILDHGLRQLSASSLELSELPRFEAMARARAEEEREDKEAREKVRERTIAAVRAALDEYVRELNEDAKRLTLAGDEAARALLLQPLHARAESWFSEQAQRLIAESEGWLSMEQARSRADAWKEAAVTTLTEAAELARESARVLAEAEGDSRVEAFRAAQEADKEARARLELAPPPSPMEQEGELY